MKVILGNGKLDSAYIPANVIGWRAMIRLVRNNKNFTDVTVKSWLLTDDLWIKFTYSGFKFSIETPTLDYFIDRDSKDCPDHIFLEVVKYLEEYNVKFLDKLF